MPQQEQDSRPEWMDSSPFFREDGVLDLLLEHKWELLALAASAFLFRKSNLAPGENPYLVPLPALRLAAPVIRDRFRAARLRGDIRARLDEPIKQAAKRGIASGKRLSEPSTAGPGIPSALSSRGLVTSKHLDDQLSSIILDSSLVSREIYKRIIHEGVPYIDELIADMDNPHGRFARGVGLGAYKDRFHYGDPAFADPPPPPPNVQRPRLNEDVWNEDDTLNLDKFKIKEDEREFFGTRAQDDREMAETESLLAPIMGYGNEGSMPPLADWRGLARTAGTYGAIARLIYELNKPRDISGPDDKGSVRIDPGRRR